MEKEKRRAEEERSLSREREELVKRGVEKYYNGRVLQMEEWVEFPGVPKTKKE